MKQRKPGPRTIKTGSQRYTITMLPSKRRRPPGWVLMVRRKRRGLFGACDTPWHRRMIPVMGRKSRRSSQRKVSAG